MILARELKKPVEDMVLKDSKVIICNLCKECHILIKCFGKWPFKIKGIQEPMSRSEQLPYIPVTAFSQTSLFLD